MQMYKWLNNFLVVAKTETKVESEKKKERVTIANLPFFLFLLFFLSAATAATAKLFFQWRLVQERKNLKIEPCFHPLQIPFNWNWNWF